LILLIPASQAASIKGWATVTWLNSREVEFSQSVQDNSTLLLSDPLLTYTFSSNGLLLLEGYLRINLWNSSNPS
jgi:hypothetical protein